MEHAQRVTLQHRYFRCQRDICFESELFSDKYEQGSKIIMLFAEIFSYVSRTYGLSGVVTRFSDFSNTALFKHWFWKVKYLLGEHLKQDPDQLQIGEWLGKGLYLKIILSFIFYNDLPINEDACFELISKQIKFLKEFRNQYGNPAMIFYFQGDSYILLGEKTCLNYGNSTFLQDNLLF